MAQGDVFGVIKCDLSQVLPWFFGCGIAREKTFYVILKKLTNSKLNDRNIAKDIISEGSWVIELAPVHCIQVSLEQASDEDCVATVLG